MYKDWPGDVSTDDACYQPGWSNGPEYTGGPPDEYKCERPGNHNGPHGWGEVEWPVTKGLVN